ncbi:Uncharacterised protein [Achromobacter denitrificans]|uniref:hypothetical protein n=1 Tax=Achromobacter denitrificans TaxID=32002 RepID=UPI0007882A60|nr:hypothetical protein [Achromobacter denitrificans]OLU08088.1 hypothetical protein BVK87_11685 [Achromobacter denitrificans]QKH42670.1 hypothetical protein FOC82_14795 [Achromobacter denitrificans]QKH50187.1 hypothetical protein FOC80_12355 [Achromobacter denitrificans]CAB3676706.1 hypothetical protein LMG1231_01349 [Achromobacter denitrificans]SUU19083.1 Uncharacterised protein [Achromobacter denitrificans]
MPATPDRLSAVPYCCQWASAHRADQIIRGELALAEDPAWRESGARDVREYAHWASHVCGMACLSMVLAARGAGRHPVLELARRSLPYGAYTVDGDRINGMIYAPFVRYVADAFGMDARVHVGLRTDELPGLMGQAEYFIASVHPWIRWPDREPPKKGGHLVLITRAASDAVRFHNPSGEPGAQADVELPLAAFDRYFAGRGVAIMPAAA